MQITVKLVFEDEIRRVMIGDESGELTFAHLKSSVDGLFPSLRNIEFRVMWKDDDGDLITIVSNPEFLESIREMKSAVPKFFIKAIPKEEAKPVRSPAAAPLPFKSVATHEGVRCDECGQFPIVGDRFTCSVRPDFDLCSSCESKRAQPHPMIKHSTPVQRANPWVGGPPGLRWHGGRWGMRHQVGLGGPGGCGGPGEQLPPPPHPFFPPAPATGPMGGRGCPWRDNLARRMNRTGTNSVDVGTAGAGTVPVSAFVAAMDASTSTASQAVHHGVTCDGCRASPIVGNRFKCSVRPNFDLCETCEFAQQSAPGVHSATMFPMLKIARPEQAPGTFVYMFNQRGLLDVLGEEGHGGRGGWGRGHGGHGWHRQGWGSVGAGAAHGGHQVVHRHITCDGCKAYPLCGPRFKCAVRPDFDLCASCEARGPQPYPMVKIYHPNHRPSTLVYAPASGATPAAASAPARPAAAAQGVVEHLGVACNQCHVCPIPGPRYKCTTRLDYDLCSNCERAAPQPFPLLKISDPAQAPARFQFEVNHASPLPVILAGLEEVHSGVRCDGCGADPIHGPRFKCVVRPDFDLCARCEAQGQQPYPMVKIYADMHHPSKLVFAFADAGGAVAACAGPGADGTTCAGAASAGAACAGAGAACATAPPSAVAHVAGPSAVATLPKPSLRFVRDRTLPDGYLVLPGEPLGVLRKIWDVRNDGNRTWPQGCRLTFVSGDVLHCPSEGGGEEVGEAVPLLKPGEEGQLSVQLFIPERAGRYTSYFRMQTAAGQLFGQRLWAEFVVSDAYAQTQQRKREEEAARAQEEADLQAIFAALDVEGEVEGAAEEQQAPSEEAEVAAVQENVPVDSATACTLCPSEDQQEAVPAAAEEDVAQPVVAVPLSPVPEGEPGSEGECGGDWEVVRTVTSVPAEPAWRSAAAAEVEESDSDDSAYSAGLHQPLSLSACAGSNGAVAMALGDVDGSADFDEETSPRTAHTDTAAPVAVAVAGEKAGNPWHRELQMLHEMGFTDAAAVLPLLELHLGAPAGSDGAVNTEGLHAVLSALLCQA